MKLSRYVLLAALQIINLCATGQTIKYDFKSLPSEIEANANYKRPVTIVIENINKKLFKVSVDKSTTNFNIAVPDALKSIKAPGFLFLAPLPASTATDQAAAAPKSPKAKSIEKKIQDDFAAVNQKGIRLTGTIYYNNDVSHAASDCETAGSKIITGLETLTTTFLYKAPALPAGKTSSDLPQLLKDTLDNIYASLPELMNKLDTEIEEYINQVNDDYKSQSKTAQTQIDGITNKLKTSRPVDKPEYSAKLEEQKKLQADIASEQADFKNVVATLKNNLKDAHDIADAITAFRKEDKFYAIVNTYKILSNPSTYTYTADPFTPKADEVKLTMTITPVDVNTCNLPDTKTTVFTFKVKGGFKMDFSAGIFVNGGSESFLGETYYWQNITDSTRKIMTAQRSKRLMLSIGGLVHFYQRSPKFLKLGGSLGASTTASFDDLNFHVGPSLILGNKNRLVLTAGATFKTSKALDQQLVTETIYKTKYSPDAIPAVGVFPKVGWFIAVTYNLNLD